MTKVFHVLVLALFAFLYACCRNQVAVNGVPEKYLSQMIHIKNVELTEKTVILDYIVSNPYEHEIWVCEDIDRYGKYDVETRIAEKTLCVKLRLLLEINILRSRAVYARYRRLAPGDSRLGRVVLNLPARNASPLFSFGERHKNRRKITLRSVCLEVGYFKGDLLKMISERIKKDEREVHKIKQSHSQDDAIYLSHLWPGLVLETASKAIVADVNIPGSVVVE